MNTLVDLTAYFDLRDTACSSFFFYSFLFSGQIEYIYSRFDTDVIKNTLREYMLCASIVDTSTNTKTIALRVYIVLTTPFCLPQSR